MEAIKQQALALGFDDFAWFKSEKLYETLNILNTRRALDMELEIEEKDLSKRVDPTLSLLDVETVMVGFLQIPIPIKQKARTGWGNLSSVSWGEDYHRILGELLEKLVKELKIRYPKEQFYTQVDTGPLCERSFANLTGTGVIGRHGNFIHSQLGSYVAIGLILTSLETEKEPISMGSKCGKCQRCAKACPGSAISSDGSINPQKCISWLTQKKGNLTTNEATSMGSSLYGCDICQLVCPQNEDIIKKDTTRWGKLLRQVECSHLSELSNREFKKMYGRLSGSWRGKKVWVRNAEIIIKNQRNLWYNGEDQ